MLDFRGRGVNVTDWRLRPRHPPQARISTRPGKFFSLTSKVPSEPPSRQDAPREEEKCVVAKPKTARRTRQGIPASRRTRRSSAASAVLHTCSKSGTNGLQKCSETFSAVPGCSKMLPKRCFCKTNPPKQEKRANRSSPLGSSLGCSFVETNPPPLYISSACTSSA